MKARLDPISGGECAVEKRVDWLHVGAEEEGKGKQVFNPFGEAAGEEEGDVIEEYFVERESKVQNEEEQKKSIPVLSSDRSEPIEETEQERPTRAEKALGEKKKPGKRSNNDLVDWFIVD